MAREFQPLLLRNLDISIEGFRILRLVLNRHTPQVDRVSRHEHEDYHQCLVYLKGRGHQLFSDQEIAVRRGSLIFIPQKMRHGFRKERALRPLCLGIDFKSKTAGAEWKVNSHLNPAALKRLELGLIQLGELQDSLSIAGTILDLVGILRETATKGETSMMNSTGQLAAQIRREAQVVGLNSISIRDVVKRLGFAKLSNLNRQLHAEGNPTVSRILSAEKLTVATSKLRETTTPIGEIAEQIGFLDQNYFARWFKTQTGQTPTECRKG